MSAVSETYKNSEQLREQIVVANQELKEKKYWMEKFLTAPEKTIFPGDIIKGNLKQETPSIAHFNFPREIEKKLLSLSNGSDARLYMILLAGVAALISKYTGKRDIVIASPVHRQEDIGNYINTIIALRFSLSNNITFKDLVLYVKDTVIEASEHQNYPIEALLYQLFREVKKDEFPLSDIAVVCKNIQEKQIIEQFYFNTLFAFFRDGNTIHCEFEYNPNLYRRDSIERYFSHLTVFFQKVFQNMDIPISKIDLLSDEERIQIVDTFNKTEREYTKSKTIHQLFEEQAKLHPNRTALTIGDLKVSYQELNEQANELAYMLRKKGIKADSTIGILMSQSVELIVGILGVLKAGSAYLPIDKDVPENRLRYILDNSQISILLTDSGTTSKYGFTFLQALDLKREKLFVAERREQIKELDKLPMPDRSLVDQEKYSKRIDISMVKNSFCIQATRGCPYKCIYCHKIWPKTHIVRSAENLFDEIKYLYDIGIRRFSILDDIFNFNIKNSSRFYDLIIKNKLDIHLFFPNGLRGDILNKDYIDLMVEAGTINVALALETASPRLQKLIKKNLKIEKLRENLEYFCEKHPHVILDLNTMHGFPSETEEEAYMTLDFMKNLKWLHFPYINILKIFPNSEMADFAVKSGISLNRIIKSAGTAFHDLPDTLRKGKSFTRNYQTDFLSNYFLSVDRLKDVLPHQIKILTKEELLQKYQVYLPAKINNFKDLVKFLNVPEESLDMDSFLKEKDILVPDLNHKLKKGKSQNKPSPNAQRILLIDLSQFFSSEGNKYGDSLAQSPLGLMYLLTYLNQDYGSEIEGKIIKSQIDFDCFKELKNLLDEFNPDVIGIRALTFYKEFFHQTISMIRQWGYKVPIITGGPYPTSDCETILQDFNIDLVVLGEGEETFAEIVGKIKDSNGELPSDDELKKIKGIAFLPGKKDRLISDQYNRDVIVLDQFFKSVDKKNRRNLNNLNKANDLAYVIYTSGSTGNPKGVMIEHRSAINYISWAIDKYFGEEKSIVPFFTSPAFDLTITSIFAPLLSGNTIKIIDNPQITAIEQIIEDDEYSLIKLTPSHLKLIRDLNVEKSNIKTIIVGGEQLDTNLATDIHKKFNGKLKIFNEYGPTEATVGCMIYQFDPQKDTENSVSIGIPAANCQIYILDNSMLPVPVGVNGEVCISGDCLARGYVNEALLTSQKFIDNPFKKGERLYRTGDLAKRLPDHRIMYTGRADDQIKIRGHRIELSEIESQILTYDEIKEAVVLDIEDKAKGVILSGYIVLNEKSTLEKNFNLNSLQEHLQSNLPGYMIPSQFSVLDKIPLTINGKIDKLALRDIKGNVDIEYLPPTTEIEKQLHGIWAELLDIDKNRIGIQSDFFRMGGHSLLATNMISKIHGAFDIKLQLSEVFKNPTIKGLSDQLSEMEKESFTSIERAKKKSHYRMSSAQKRLYIVQQMDETSIAYNQPGLLKYAKTPSKKKLEQIIIKIIKRHEILRTSFNLLEGEPVQIVADKVKFNIEYAESESEAETDKIFRKFVRPFDLNKAPLIRIGLVNQSDTEHFLMVDTHHIVSDGVSRDILIQDFMDLHNEKELAPLKLQYRDYAEWQNKKEQLQSIEEQKQYWVNQLSGKLPKLKLPLDFQRPASLNFDGEIIEFQFENEIMQKLIKLKENFNATFFILFQAVFNVFLMKITGQKDILVGTDTAGRNHPDLQKVMGFFVNTVVLRNYPAFDMTFKDFLSSAKETTLKAFDNQDFQFDDLVNLLGIDRELNRNPLFDVAFYYHTFRIPPKEILGLSNSNSVYRNKTAKFDLTFTVDGSDENDLLCSFEYNTNLFTKQKVESFVKILKEVVSSVATNPNSTLEDIIVSEHLLVQKKDEVSADDLDF